MTRSNCLLARNSARCLSSPLMSSGVVLSNVHCTDSTCKGKSTHIYNIYSYIDIDHIQWYSISYIENATDRSSPRPHVIVIRATNSTSNQLFAQSTPYRYHYLWIFHVYIEDNRATGHGNGTVVQICTILAQIFQINRTLNIWYVNSCNKIYSIELRVQSEEKLKLLF